MFSYNRRFKEDFSRLLQDLFDLERKSTSPLQFNNEIAYLSYWKARLDLKRRIRREPPYSIDAWSVIRERLRYNWRSAHGI